MGSFGVNIKYKVLLAPGAAIFAKLDPPYWTHDVVDVSREDCDKLLDLAGIPSDQLAHVKQCWRMRPGKAKLLRYCLSANVESMRPVYMQFEAWDVFLHSIATDTKDLAFDLDSEETERVVPA